MLQRIQTVYLLIIVALTVATLFLPLAVLQQGDALFSFDASGLSTMIGEPELLYPAWGLFALTAIIAIIALVTIFLYKKRILQIRLCVFNALLILGFYGFFAFLIYSLKGDMEGGLCLLIFLRSKHRTKFGQLNLKKHGVSRETISGPMRRWYVLWIVCVKAFQINHWV